MARHLYVHIPFCRSKCAYCDFASETVAPHSRAGRLKEYVDALRGELSRRSGVLNDGQDTTTGSTSDHGSFETIYLGGGTPTVLPDDLLFSLVDHLSMLLAEGGEFTVEANPGNIDVGLLARLRESGANRLSLGIESFSEVALAALGRRVRRSEIEAAVEAIKTVGWQEWNLDLIFGIPGLSWADTQADLDAAVAAAPSHISLYDLTYSPAYERFVEVKVGAGARRAAGTTAEDHYAGAVARLETAGYRRYEVSNFALPGHECKHNLAYWRGEDYLGVGAAAVSTEGAERRTNPEKVVDYLGGRAPRLEALTSETRLWEKAMLGLRTSEGVDEESVTPVLDLDARDGLLAQGCLERGYGKLRLNAGFLDVSNSVIAALLVSPGGRDSSTPAGDDTHR